MPMLSGKIGPTVTAESAKAFLNSGPVLPSSKDNTRSLDAPGTEKPYKPMAKMGVGQGGGTAATMGDLKKASLKLGKITATPMRGAGAKPPPPSKSDSAPKSMTIGQYKAGKGPAFPGSKPAPEGKSPAGLPSHDGTTPSLVFIGSL